MPVRGALRRTQSQPTTKATTAKRKISQKEPLHNELPSNASKISQLINTPRSTSNKQIWSHLSRDELANTNSERGASHKTNLPHNLTSGGWDDDVEDDELAETPPRKKFSSSKGPISRPATIQMSSISKGNTSQSRGEAALTLNDTDGIITTPHRSLRLSQADSALIINMNDAPNDEDAITYSKREADGMQDVDRYARQVLITWFDNRRRVEVVELAYPLMNPKHPVYKDALQKTAKHFKCWRHRVMAAARAWIINYMQLPENADIANTETCKELKKILSRRIQLHWIKEVFTFAAKHIFWAKISPLAWLFIKYAFVMLTSAGWFNYLHQNEPGNPAYLKYDKDHMSRIFDNLHDKAEFNGKLKINDFPLLPFTGYLKSHYGAIDLDDDSDAEVDEELAD